MKNVIILEPNSAGIKLIHAARKMNCKVHVLSYNCADRKISSDHLHGCNLIIVDTNDEKEVKNAIINLSKCIAIDAIVPGFEYYVPLASRMAALLGLIGLPPRTVMAMRFKHEMRKKLADDGIKNPWFVVINSIGDLVGLKHISFPCVFKPSHLAGSLYIKKFYNLDDLVNHYNEYVNDQYKDLGCQISGCAIIEEYIAGREFSVEGYVSNNKISYVSVTDKFLSNEPVFVEVGHITRADINKDVSDKLVQYTESVVKSLGINVGPFHCEMRMTDHGPFLIEIGARLVGDNISEIIELSTGISLAEIMIQSYLGEPVPDYDFNNIKCHAGVRFLYGEAGAKFKGLGAVNEVINMPGFSRMASLKTDGDIIPPMTDFRARIGEVIFTGSSQAEVKQRLDQASSLLV